MYYEFVKVMLLKNKISQNGPGSWFYFLCWFYLWACVVFFLIPLGRCLVCV